MPDQSSICAVADTLLGLLLLHDADVSLSRHSVVEPAAVTRDQVRQCVAAMCFAAAMVRAQVSATGRSRLEEGLMCVAFMVAMISRALDSCDGPAGRAGIEGMEQCKPVAVVTMVIVVLCSSATWQVCLHADDKKTADQKAPSSAMHSVI